MDVIQRTQVRPATQDLRAAVLERVGVSPPYFAISAMQRTEPTLSTWAHPELNPPLERGPMSAADLGRHGAISGLSAVALGRGGAKAYYLASPANMSVHTVDYVLPAEGLHFAATPTRVTGRRTHALVQAYAGDLHVASLDVGYITIDERLFRRTHKLFSHIPSGLERSYNPSIDGALRWREGDLVYESVLPEHIGVGHFAEYRCLPVATMLYHALRMIGEFLNGTFAVTYVEADAKRLVSAGERVRFVLERSGRRFTWTCVASGEEPTATLIIDVSI